MRGLGACTHNGVNTQDGEEGLGSWETGSLSRQQAGNARPWHWSSVLFSQEKRGFLCASDMFQKRLC